MFTVERRLLDRYGWRWCLIRDDILICHYKLWIDAALDAWERNKPVRLAA